MHPYSKSYLLEAMENMGEMTAFVHDVLGMDLDDFWRLFVVSGVAREFASGSPRTLVGRSGAELALEVCEKTGAMVDVARAVQILRSNPMFDLTASYWCGWILAFYQWHSGLSFQRIHDSLGFARLMRAYPTLHEASEMRFAQEADAIVFGEEAPCALKRARAAAGLSQSQLAKASGVGIRAIQQYEQGAKDITKAAAGNVAALAQALHCQVGELLEKRPEYEYAYVTL